MKNTLFTFYDFPATQLDLRKDHKSGLSQPLHKSRLRTHKTKGCGSRNATLSMVFKLTIKAAKTWKKLKGHQLILMVLENKKFVDGELAQEAAP